MRGDGLDRHGGADLDHHRARQRRDGAGRHRRSPISGTATDTGGGVGGVEVSVDGGTTWHPASGRANWSYTWTPGIGLGHDQDPRGGRQRQPGTPGAGVTVTVGSGTPPTGCPCTDLAVFGGADGGGSDADTSAVNLGVKFRGDVNGFITGIRFYKGPGNAGTHVGSLWTSGGTLLASATFAGETASGWQQVNFAAPVAVTANTVYVASYLAPAMGATPADNSYFAANGVDNAARCTR